MRNLADRIEHYLKQILENTEAGYVILQRGVLAEEFSCAPSQINYVLDTRFNVDRGYLVESRRGGGGYLRIVRLGINTDSQLQQAMRQIIGNQLTQERAYSLIERLLTEELVTVREAALIRCVLSTNTLDIEPAAGEILRAKILKKILVTLCREDLE